MSSNIADEGRSLVEKLEKIIQNCRHGGPSAEEQVRKKEEYESFLTIITHHLLQLFTGNYLVSTLLCIFAVNYSLGCYDFYE